MKFRVTKEEIKNGSRADCCACPVALAIHRGPWVAGNRDIQRIAAGKNISINGRCYSPPKKVVRFIRRFDSGKDRERLRPFSFELSIE